MPGKWEDVNDWEDVPQTGFMDTAVNFLGDLGFGAAKGMSNIASLPGELAKSNFQSGTNLLQGMIDRIAPMILPENKAALASQLFQQGTSKLSGMLPGKEDTEAALGSIGLLGNPQDTTSRITQRAGEEIGSGLLGFGALAKMPSVSSPLLNQMKQGFAKNPGGFFLGDLAASGITGTSAGAAKEMFPNNPYAEMLGQFLPIGVMAGGQAAVRGLLRGGESGRQMVQQNIDDYARAGTSPTLGEAVSGTPPAPVVQGFQSTLGRVPGSSMTLRKKALETVDDMGRAVNNIGRNLSGDIDSYTVGANIQSSIKGQYVPKFMEKAARLDDNLVSAVGAETPTKVTNTQKILSELITPTQGIENTSQAVKSNKFIDNFAQAFTKDIGDGDSLPFGALKELRSQIGQKLNSSDLITDLPKSAFKRLYGALSEDMKSAAVASGPAAERAFRVHNKFYSTGRDKIDKFLQPIVDNKYPEKIVRGLELGGKEGFSQIARVKSSLSKPQWEEVVGVVVKRLGKATPSNQDDVGEAFSTNTFLTNWNKLDPKTRKVLFSGTSSLRRYGDDLNVIARAMSNYNDVQRVLANPSGTAAALTEAAGAIGGISAMASGNPIAIKAIASVMGASYTTSKALLTNANFVNWLAKATTVQAKDMPRHMARLTNLYQDADPETKSALDDFIGQVESDQTK